MKYLMWYLIFIYFCVCVLYIKNSFRPVKLHVYIYTYKHVCVYVCTCLDIYINVYMRVYYIRTKDFNCHAL